MKDIRVSKKTELAIRRITLRNGEHYSVRPSFVLPSMTARVDEVSGALFLAKWAPLWALEEVFHVNTSKLHRIINTVDVPTHLLADEHHEKQNSEKVYIATTVAEGCVLGAEVCPSASGGDLAKVYGVFKAEALELKANDRPQTVNTDGWKGSSGRPLHPG